MRNYEYKNMSYTKRPLTANLLVHVISADPSCIQTADYEQAAWITKGAELASQADACPMVGRDLIIPVYNCIRREPGVRARHVETGSAIAMQGTFGPYTDADAACQIACGTLANFAESYDKAMTEQMLTHGILPIVTEAAVPVGTLIYIKSIRNALLSGTCELEAYFYDREKDDFLPVSMRMPEYSTEMLENILS